MQLAAFDNIKNMFRSRSSEMHPGLGVGYEPHQFDFRQKLRIHRQHISALPGQPKKVVFVQKEYVFAIPVHCNTSYTVEVMQTF
ncbi:hypothetical protein D1872_226090 [compost metagenome]